MTGGIWALLAGPALSAIMTVGSFTQTMVTIDFDSFATGPTTLGAIQSSAPEAGISGLSLGCFGVPAGEYNFNLAGNGLACSSDDGLEIYPELAFPYFDMNSFTLELDHFVTEIGFQHGDRTGLGSSVSLFADNVLVGSFSPGEFENNLLRLQSSVAFNKFVLEEDRNWLVTELVIQARDTVAVPTPATLLLITTGLLGLSSRLRRRQSQDTFLQN